MVWCCEADTEAAAQSALISGLMQIGASRRSARPDIVVPIR